MRALQIRELSRCLNELLKKYIFVIFWF